MTLAEVPLVLMLAGLIAYAVLGGADFGAAFWQLGAGRGPAAEERHEHAHRAMGPVWEANHVWLVFVLVTCWSAYPEVFASIFSTLTVPLFVASIGIILRGTAYALHAGAARRRERRAVDLVLSTSSILVPFALGTSIGAIASGRVPVGNAKGDLLTSWVNPTSFAAGAIAVATGVYLSAVYLAGDAVRARLDDLAVAFRLRALASGVVTGAIAVAGLVVVSLDAPRLRDGLFHWPGILALTVSAIAGLVTLELVRHSRFEVARYVASAAVAAVVVGWALAQQPELLPGLTVQEAAAGRPTLIVTIVAIAFGAVTVGPPLVLLFGLVLQGRFDDEAAAPMDAGSPGPQMVRRRAGALVGVAIVALAAGLPLTFIGDGGPVQGVGVVCLFVFFGLGAVALGSMAAAAAIHDDTTDGAEQ